MTQILEPDIESVQIACPFCTGTATVQFQRLTLLIAHTLPMCREFEHLAPDDYWHQSYLALMKQDGYTEQEALILARPRAGQA